MSTTQLKTCGALWIRSAICYDADWPGVCGACLGATAKESWPTYPDTEGCRGTSHQHTKGAKDLEKPISTRLHGILDYATAGTLLTLPRLLNASPKAANAMAVAATGLLGYSMATRYEYGVWKKIPMPVHLALDGISGAALLAARFTFMKGEAPSVVASALGVGLMEVSAALLTQPKPPIAERAKYAYLDLAS